MKRCLRRCNMILFGLLVGGAVVTGCKSDGDKNKEATILRFHLETNPTPLGRTMPVIVGRSAPFELVVEEKPFLSELFIIEATLLEGVGGHEIRVKFDRQGTWLLEQSTTAHKGKHVAIYSSFGEARWLAAPRIRQTIDDGVFVFSPDATFAEAQRIVRGLQNVAEKVRKEP